jgi:transposase-like protein
MPSAFRRRRFEATDDAKANSLDTERWPSQAKIAGRTRCSAPGLVESQALLRILQGAGLVSLSFGMSTASARRTPQPHPSDHRGNREEGSHVPLVSRARSRCDARPTDLQATTFVAMPSSLPPAQVTSGAGRVWPQRGPPSRSPRGRRASSLTRTSNQSRPALLCLAQGMCASPSLWSPGERRIRRRSWTRGGGRVGTAELHRRVQGRTVQLVLDEGKTVCGVARDLDLTASALRAWVERARADPIKGKTGLPARSGRSSRSSARRCAKCARLGGKKEADRQWRFRSRRSSSGFRIGCYDIVTIVATGRAFAGRDRSGHTGGGVDAQ